MRFAFDAGPSVELNRFEALSSWRPLARPSGMRRRLTRPPPGVEMTLVQRLAAIACEYRKDRVAISAGGLFFRADAASFFFRDL
jgi:hypothetical protein